MIYRKPPARAEIQDGEVPRRLAVVCCFFGFAKYQKPAGNVRRFVRQMAREGVAVYGAEAYVDEPRLPELGWLCVRAGENQILWQKEALLNLAAAQVPEEYNAVAWIDPDVWFANGNWRAQAEDRLRSHGAVQLFSNALWTGADGAVNMRRDCSAKAPGMGGHPGFAWALRREMWPLPDWHCTGSGDQEMVQMWKQQGAVSWIQGDCYHEYHGERPNRQYYDRHKWRNGIPARECVTKAANGLMEWSAKAPESLREQMRQYFIDRKEDG